MISGMWKFQSVPYRIYCIHKYTILPFLIKVFLITYIITGGPCNLRILGEMKIRELQNREFQGTLHLGLYVS